MMPGQRGRGFARVELTVVLLILVFLVALCSIFTTDNRRRARLAGSIQNLQQQGNAAAAFAADRENRVFSFDWVPGPHECDGYVFPPSGTYNDAAADQAVCIIREQTGRRDISAIRSWIPYILYNHLTLIDYLDDTLPSPMLVSPGDEARLAWQRAARVASADPSDNGAAYFRLVCRPAGVGNNEKRWPYSSSYEVQPSFFSPDSIVYSPQGNVLTIAQDTQGHRYYNTGSPQTVLGNRRFDQVSYPSHKAFIYETNQRFFGERQYFFMYSGARVPVLCADGNVSVRSMNTANPGYQPNLPTSTNPTRVNYQPELTWEAPTANGGTQEFVNGVIRWTRFGLRGRDFMGAEVPWTP